MPDGFRYNVSLSHRANDQPRVRRLAERLPDGLDEFLLARCLWKKSVEGKAALKRTQSKRFATFRDVTTASRLPRRLRVLVCGASSRSAQ